MFCGTLLFKRMRTSDTKIQAGLKDLRQSLYICVEDVETKFKVRRPPSICRAIYIHNGPQTLKRFGRAKVSFTRQIGQRGRERTYGET